jgi:hypothetical protein
LAALDPSLFGPREDISDDFVLAAGDGPDPDGSVYFTPEGTPLREPGARGEVVAANGSPLKFSSAEASSQPIRRTHRKSKSFSHFLPQRWLQQEEASPSYSGINGGGQQRTVRAIIEHVTPDKKSSGDELNMKAEEVRDRTRADEEVAVEMPASTEDITLAPLAQSETYSDGEEAAEDEALVVTVEGGGEKHSGNEPTSSDSQRDLPIV